MRGEERREREREQRAPAAIALSIDDSLFAHFFLRLLSPVHFEAPLHGQHDLVDGPPGRLEDGIETVKGVVRGARHGESISSPAPARRRVFFFFCEPLVISVRPAHQGERRRRSKLFGMRDSPAERPGVAPADAQREPREPTARSQSREPRETAASELGEVPVARALIDGTASAGTVDGDGPRLAAPARAPSPAPHLTAPPAAYVPDFLGSFEGIKDDGDDGAAAAGAGGEGSILGGSGRPVARAPRDSEPGGWLGVEREGGRCSGTPPAVSRLSSLTLEDALSRATPGAGADAVGASVAATVGGHGGWGAGGGAAFPSSAVSPSPADGNAGGNDAKKAKPAPSSDGLLGGEASWWAAAAGSIYPCCPPLPHPLPTEAALWAACAGSSLAAAEAEPLLAPHILRVVAACSSLPEALAAVVLDRLLPSGASGDAEVAGATPPLPSLALATAALELTAAADLAAALFRDGSGVVSGVERMILSSPTAASNGSASPPARGGRFFQGNGEGSGGSRGSGSGSAKKARSPRITITSSLASLGGTSASSPRPLDSVFPSPCSSPPPPSPPPPLSPPPPPPSTSTSTDRTAGEVLLFHDGLHALSAQRIAAQLLASGRRGAALALQARASEVLGADLHPGARFAPGVLLCHPFGIVVGEASVVESGAVLCHAVTLGGNGKQKGDRHPKVGAGAMIGPRASVLGNIRVGENAKVAAAALVLREVPPGALAAGSPASIVGRVDEIGWDL